jgi:hypothetical protein
MVCLFGHTVPVPPVFNIYKIQNLVPSYSPVLSKSFKRNLSLAFTWEVFCDLSIEELGELQNKNYYTEKSTRAIKDRTGQRVAYDHSTKK